jgi:ribosomal protein S18 acetylase RimI-like enzyme
LRKYFRSIEAQVGRQDPEAATAAYLRTPASAWLAHADGLPAGCVAMRPLAGRICELKHLFVLPRYRGMRLARRLMRAAHRHARAAGFTAVNLDTLESMTSAQALYIREGYVTCEPYYEDGVRRIFFCKTLGSRHHRLQRRR